MIGTALIAAACLGNGVLLLLKLRMMRRLANLECPPRSIISATNS